VIEDLRVSNTDLARSYKEIERANTDLVGKNTALEDRVRGKLLYTFLLLFARYFLCCLIFPRRSLQGLRMSFCCPGRGPLCQGSARGGGRFEQSTTDCDKRPLGLLGARASG